MSIQIIYINGPSSSGKTTLAHALQQALDQPFLHIGIDKVIGMMPDKMNNWEAKGKSVPGFSWKRSVDPAGYRTHEIQAGPFGLQMVKALKEMVVTLARMGQYVIVDDVAFGKRDLDLWRTYLKDFEVLWIGIQAPVEILEQRERDREDNRMWGSARDQHWKVHEDATYDLEFDTSRTPLKTIVNAILEVVNSKAKGI